MKPMAVLPLLLPMLAFAGPAMAQTCRNSAAVTGKCTVVRGSLGLTRGLGVTLETGDGRRILIKAPPDSNADIPRDVMQHWLYWQSRTGHMDIRITGHFQICPLPARPNSAGIANFACINSGSHIAADKSPPDASN
jgi:hypothetical protein